MNLLLMCLEFFKTGLLSIGGGLATLPFLYHMADNYPWFTRAQLSDMIAVSEATPGPMGVNMATYAGFTTAGIPGAILATFSLVLPSILVKRVLFGLRPASVGLIAAAGWGILKLALYLDLSGPILSWISWKALGLGIVLSVLYGFFGTKVHPIVFILAGAVAGLVMSL